MRTLHQVFDPRNNALNAVRLALALGVIFWHSFPRTVATSRSTLLARSWQKSG